MNTVAPVVSSNPLDSTVPGPILSRLLPCQPGEQTG